jgi:putative flippase GtrA
MPLVAFGLVGAFAAAMHYIVAVAVVTLAGTPPMVANIDGYCVALITSWLGQSRLTFREAPRTAWTPVWFALTSLSGFALNALAYAALLRWTTLDYRVSLAIVLLSVAVLTWTLCNLWVFAGSRVRSM